MAVGDLVITTGAVRQEGTSDEYVREDYPAAADYEVVSALVAAAERLGYEYHTGVTMSADSFYAGQGRPGFDGFEAAGADDLVDELKAANVTNIEMEASAILTLASLYGLRAGAVCTVYANRETGEFRTEGESRAAETDDARDPSAGENGCRQTGERRRPLARRPLARVALRNRIAVRNRRVHRVNLASG